MSKNRKNISRSTATSVGETAKHQSPRTNSNAQRRHAQAAVKRRYRTIQRAIAGGVGVLILAGAIALTFGHSSSSGTYRTTTENWRLPKLAVPGQVALSSFRGHPVIVNFFASWCTVCAGELPVFTRDAVALRGRIDFVEVNALETGNGGAFAQQYQLASQVTAVASDVGGSQGDGLYQALGGTGTMPMTAFYDARGRLITTHIGGFDAASLAAAVKQLYGVTVPV